MNTTIAYKCVKRMEEGTLQSWVTNKYFVVYAKDVVTLPKIGELFVFATLEDALDFYKREIKAGSRMVSPYAEIWQAEATDAHELMLIAIIAGAEYIEDFWNPIHSKGARNSPRGTLGCTSVKLLKKMEI